MALGFSILRPMNGCGQVRVRCSVPCTKIRLGKTPEPMAEIGPMMVWADMARETPHYLSAMIAQKKPRRSRGSSIQVAGESWPAA
jgi:hypothetical protein